MRYLGLHLDQRLTYVKHIKTKRLELNLRMRQLYWLLGPRLQLSLAKKLLVYVAMLWPVWCYRMHLWGCASRSSGEYIQHFQNKILRLITAVPWYVRNLQLHEDLKVLRWMRR